VCEYAGITYRQLDTWVRADRLAPATPAGGSGSRREFTLAEAGVARRMASLIGQGFQLAAAAEIARDYPEARLGVSLANVPAPDLRGPAWHPSVRAPDWRDRAACLDTDPEVFHPELGGTTKPAKRICAGCDVREECLMWALAQPGSLTGIFGGTSGRERARIRAHLSPAGAA
jgi:WhiB family redox-sensing transcriptional regulator